LWELAELHWEWGKSSSLEAFRDPVWGSWSGDQGQTEENKGGKEIWRED
jgi:hypothetical protein